MTITASTVKMPNYSLLDKTTSSGVHKEVPANFLPGQGQCRKKNRDKFPQNRVNFAQTTIFI